MHPDPTDADRAAPEPDDPGPSWRPMRVLHLMALVAAAGATLAVTPPLFEAMRDAVYRAGWMPLWDPGQRFRDENSIALMLWTPALATIAAIARRSRPRGGGLPYGAAAAYAATAALLLHLTRCLSESLLLYSGPVAVRLAMRMLHESPHGAAAAVVAAWLILALAGAGRKPSSWFDALGVLLGLAWVAHAVAGGLLRRWAFPHG